MTQFAFHDPVPSHSYTFEGIATALSSISHGGDSKGGTVSVFHREKFCVGGRLMELPTITGNSIRGILRDKGMLFMLRALGYGEKEAVRLSVPAFHFLTSGGALGKDNGRGIDIGEERRLRERIPLVGVFAGATGRHIMPSKLITFHWTPVCKELQAFIPERYQGLPEAQVSIYDFLDIQSYSRIDNAKDYRWHEYIEAPQPELLLAPKTRTTKAGEEIAEKPGVAQQMRYGFEVLCAGTKFYVKMRLNDVTDLEFEAFLSALYEWSKSPLIGGQHRVGHGLVELHLDDWVEVSPLARVPARAVSLPLGEAYMQHLQSHKLAILETLAELS